MMISASLAWFLAGVVFLIAELAMPAFILIFFTAGCWVAATFVWLIDITLTRQILIFLLSSLFLLFTLRKFSLKVFRGKTQDEVDDHYSDSMIGKTAVVTKRIAPHTLGEIKVMGSFWRATANEEIEEGASVLIEKKDSEDGLTLRVKSI